MRVVVIADDLTGALDSAVAFSVRGLRTICARSVEHLAAALAAGPDVVAVSTGSRELTDAEAVARVVAVRAALDACPTAEAATWFKKIDSRLKGHVAAETEVLRRPGQRMAVCPAIPRLGRHVVAGAVVGGGVSEPIPVAPAAGVDPGQVLDAKTESDIDDGLAQVADDALLVGAAGLAEALARALLPGVKPLAAPVLRAPALIAIGSRDPVTLAQLNGFECVPAANGSVPAPVAWRDDFCLLQLVPGSQSVAPAEAGARFAAGVAAWVSALAPATLIASGGETAAAIMQRLGIGLLDIEGEALPGLPVSRALDGHPGLAIVTKSGGFGAPDTLVNLVGKLVKSS